MFGVYDILETVGQGGMGIVYRAHDTALDRVVALKVLKEDLRTNKQIAARFQREAEAYASLDHPNIVHIYTVGSVGRIPYIAMEFISGEPLSTLMKREKRIDWKRTLHMGKLIAEALASAHEVHIIHRDIKPANILIDSGDRPVVTDFGIAKVLTAETQLTVEGSRLGTPQYMSPERCMDRTITSSSDMYSLGVVMFQMISGRLPYEASTPVELIKKIVSDPPLRLSDLVEGIPRDVERLIAYLIEKKPGNRPPDATTVATLCQRVLDGEPLREESSTESSLRELRDSMATPVSSSTTHSEIDSFAPLASLRRYWADLSLLGRMWWAGSVLIVGAALMGYALAQQANEGFALDTVRGWDRGTASWIQVSSPAEFSAESRGVELVRVNLPMFRPVTIAPLGPGSFAIELEGLERSTRASERTIVVLQPDRHRLQLAFPPFAAPSLDGPLLLGAENATASSRTAPATFLFARPVRNLAAGETIAIFESPISLAENNYGREVITLAEIDAYSVAGADRIGIVAASPAHPALLAALGNASNSGWRLVELSLDKTGELEDMTPFSESGPPIEHLTFDWVGGVLYAQADPKGRASIWRVPRGGDVSTRVRVWRAENATSRVLDVNASDVLFTRAQGSENMAELFMSNFADGSETALGEAQGATLASRGTAILTAPDRRGDTQLWLADPDEDLGRRQLTYLVSGLRRDVAVSADGRFAVGVSAEEGLPGLIVVDVEQALTDEP